MAYEYALRYHLPMQAGSDSHHVDYPRNPCGISLETRAESIGDIIEAIKTGKAALVM